MEIEDILSNATSVVVIFDGYDEYPDQTQFKSEVNEIIRGEMYPNFAVIFTTRSACLPKYCLPNLRRLRLKGFDSTAQEQYIRKVVPPREIDKTIKKIQRMLRANAVVADLCQVPLFFVMFTYMAHENENIQQFSSVTSFFRYMISCFHGHVRNKMTEEDEQKCKEFEGTHSRLDELAFQGLSASEHQLVWNKEEIIAQLGTDFYEHYKKVGILVEEETQRIHDEPGTLGPQHIQNQTEVRFYHKLFCEWYAAHHLLSQLPKGTSDNLLEVLDPFDLQYVYRFACGLNPDIGEKIIKYLKQSKEGDTFAILCILEQDGKVDNILDTVKILCRGAVEIRTNHNRLLQRSIIQLLDISTCNKKIQTSCVRLVNCVKSVDEDSQNIVLKSGVGYPVSTSIDGLVITDMGREWTDEEVAGILHYSTKCIGMKSLWFNYCLLPRSFVVGPFLSTLLSMNVTVSWSPGTGSLYRLNLDSGRWERYHKGIEMMETEGVLPSFQDTSPEYFLKSAFEEPSQMTQEQYANLVTKFREMWSHTHWQRSPVDVSEETRNKYEINTYGALGPIPENFDEE
ncbi:hypothetical protein HOLleu_02060 [Holothuria leucospilota]|uniref:NACHT domain-containing protein n=1 Tax=Holothuria leucospilota TaxID=206669 RepID=A0A9Q1HJJ5_HOLLE|nr:hypothetical protein HOLleu_02060 [Holothuria leucospilota]